MARARRREIAVCGINKAKGRADRTLGCTGLLTLGSYHTAQHTYLSIYVWHTRIRSPRALEPRRRGGPTACTAAWPVYKAVYTYFISARPPQRFPGTRAKAMEDAQESWQDLKFATSLPIP